MKSIKYLLAIFAVLMSITLQTGCDKKKKDGAHPPNDRLKQELAKEVDAGLQERPKFVPECRKEYSTHVYNRVLVKDCDNITNDEKKQMSAALIDKATNSARAICELNIECRTPQLLRYTLDRLECDRRVWEVDATFIFICK